MYVNFCLSALLVLQFEMSPFTVTLHRTVYYCRDPRQSLPGLPPAKRLGHPVLDQLGAFRTIDGLVAVFSPTGQLPRHPGGRLECGQLGIGKAGE